MSDVSVELRAVLHVKENLCAELAALPETAGVADYAGEIARICGEYANSGAVPPEYSELLDKKFSEALETAKAGAVRFEELKKQRESLVAEVGNIAAAGELATLDEIIAVEKKIAALGADPALAEQLAPLKAHLTAEAEAEKAAAEAVAKLAAELIELTAMEDISALHERKPGIEKEFEAVGKAPRSAVNSYHEALRKASVRLAQHYETIDLARWESYTLKLDICSELEKLIGVEDNALGAASKKLNEIRERWKQLGSVPKEKNGEINPRYLELTRKLQHRIDEFYARKRQQQKLAAGEKQKICEELEQLAASTDWHTTAARIQELQGQWKSLERAAGQESVLYARFRAACDQFFNARKAAFDERDRQTKAAAARKKALIAEAENLTDVRRAKQLREEYRNSGSAGRREPELYKEFNAAMDKFFAGRREVFNAREQRAKELIAEVEALTADPAGALERIRAIREELRSISCRETRSEEQNVLRKFDAALAAVRDAQRRQKVAASGDVTSGLAGLYSAFLAGETVEIPDLTVYSGFPKLMNAANLLAAAAGGDAKAADKLAKAAAAALNERESICCELEKLAGVGKNDSDAAEFSLAEELEFAMMGNFGKSSGRSSERVRDPHALLADFAGCGLVALDALQQLQRRVDAAMQIICPDQHK